MKLKTLHLVIVLFLLSAANGFSAESEGVVVSKRSNPKKDTVTSTLLLLSKGLTTKGLKEEFLGLLEKKPRKYSVAVVVNASSSEKKKLKKIGKIKRQFEELGFDSSKVVLFDVMKTPPQELMNYDIIYTLGGNPFLLLDEVHRSGADTIFKQLLNDNKILMGYSAGALLLGPDLSLMNYVDTLLEFNEIDLKELECVGAYDFYIFPHFKDFTSQVLQLAAKIEEFEADCKLPIYRLNDNQGIIYRNGKVRIVGD